MKKLTPVHAMMDISIMVTPLVLYAIALALLAPVLLQTVSAAQSIPKENWILHLTHASAREAISIREHTFVQSALNPVKLAMERLVTAFLAQLVVTDTFPMVNAYAKTVSMMTITETACRVIHHAVLAKIAQPTV
jgi:hypothetical protein